MKTNVTKNEFIEAFDRMNRGDNFSIAGRENLYDYFIELEQSTGEEIELDVIAICSEFGEYESIMEAVDDYGIDEDLSNTESIDELERQNYVIYVDGGDGAVIVRAY